MDVPIDSNDEWTDGDSRSGTTVPKASKQGHGGSKVSHGTGGFSHVMGWSINAGPGFADVVPNALVWCVLVSPATQEEAWFIEESARCPQEVKGPPQ